MCVLGEGGSGETGGTSVSRKHTVVQHSSGLGECCGRGHLHGIRDTQRDEYVNTKIQGELRGVNMYTQVVRAGV